VETTTESGTLWETFVPQNEFELACDSSNRGVRRRLPRSGKSRRV